jgi:hypothetical protein
LIQLSKSLARAAIAFPLAPKDFLRPEKTFCGEYKVLRPAKGFSGGACGLCGARLTSWRDLPMKIRGQQDKSVWKKSRLASKANGPEQKAFCAGERLFGKTKGLFRRIICNRLIFLLTWAEEGDYIFDASPATCRVL